MISGVEIDLRGLSGLQEKINLFVSPENMDTVARIVASTMKAEIGSRIHEEGKAADGSKIGEYNATDPLYVNPKNQAGISFPTIGKTGKDTFKGGLKKGQKHKTGYFASYLAFKNAIGRNKIGTVNLSLSGQMSNQFTIIATSGGYGLGWQNTEMRERATHLEAKYGKRIWGLTEDETKTVTETARFETEKFFK